MKIQHIVIFQSTLTLLLSKYNLILVFQACFTCKNQGTSWSSTPTSTPHRRFNVNRYLIIGNVSIDFGCFGSTGQISTPVRRVWRQRCLPALRGSNLRRLQRIFQANSSKERKVRLPGGQKLPGGQATKKPVPVL